MTVQLLIFSILDLVLDGILSENVPEIYQLNAEMQIVFGTLSLMLSLPVITNFVLKNLGWMKTGLMVKIYIVISK